MTDTQTKPHGELTIQTIAMPKDTNASGDIFGGWLLSQMDLAAGVIAKRVSHGRSVTVAVNSMEFHKPVKVGALVSCYCTLLKKGRTSLSIEVEAWATAVTGEDSEKVTEGIFVFVAVDGDGKPRELPK